MESFRKSAGWALILRGVMFMLFGYLILFMETRNIYGPMNFFAIVLLVSGGLYVLLAFLLRKTTKAWFYGLLWGLIDLLTGTYFILNISRATDIFTDIIGIFALIMGISILVTAFFIKGYRIFLYINSFVSLSFGFIILSNPTLGRLDFLIGLYALLLGLFISYVGLVLLRWKKKDIATDLLDKKEPINF